MICRAQRKAKIQAVHVFTDAELEDLVRWHERQAAERTAALWQVAMDYELDAARSEWFGRGRAAGRDEMTRLAVAGIVVGVTGILIGALL
jgi:hypothetical protein